MSLDILYQHLKNKDLNSFISVYEASFPGTYYAEHSKLMATIHKKNKTPYSSEEYLSFTQYLLGKHISSQLLALLVAQKKDISPYLKEKITPEERIAIFDTDGPLFKAAYSYQNLDFLIFIESKIGFDKILKSVLESNFDAAKHHFLGIAPIDDNINKIVIQDFLRCIKHSWVKPDKLELYTKFFHRQGIKAHDTLMSYCSMPENEYVQMRKIMNIISDTVQKEESWAKYIFDEQKWFFQVYHYTLPQTEFNFWSPRDISQENNKLVEKIYLQLKLTQLPHKAQKSLKKI